METLLVSACLLGENCKYSGGNNALAPETLAALAARYRLIPVCPERDGGLPTPRIPSERQGERVVNREGEDLTEAFRRGAERALETAREKGCGSALLKERSPSCGSTVIYDGSFSGKIIPGEGATAGLLRQNGVRVFSENDLEVVLRSAQPGEYELYLLGQGLQNRIDRIAEEAESRSKGEIRFEESIALPYYGQIILRFSLERDEVSMTDLDACEALLYEIAGDEFLVDFMGSVYRKAGVDYTRLGETLVRLAAELPNEELPPSVHSAGIRADAAYLLKKAGLEPTEKVWEIQIEDGEQLLLLMGRCDRPIKVSDDCPGLRVAEVREEPCIGLMKAAVYARKRGISLARLLAAR